MVGSPGSAPRTRVHARRSATNASCRSGQIGFKEYQLNDRGAARPPRSATGAAQHRGRKTWHDIVLNAGALEPRPPAGLLVDRLLRMTRLTGDPTASTCRSIAPPSAREQFPRCTASTSPARAVRPLRLGRAAPRLRQVAAASSRPAIEVVLEAFPIDAGARRDRHDARPRRVAIVPARSPRCTPERRARPVRQPRSSPSPRPARRTSGSRVVSDLVFAVGSAGCRPPAPAASAHWIMPVDRLVSPRSG